MTNSNFEISVVRSEQELDRSEGAFFFIRGPWIFKKGTYKTALTEISLDLNPNGHFVVKALHHGSLRSEGAGWLFRANFLKSNDAHIVAGEFHMGISCWDDADGLLEASGKGAVNLSPDEFAQVQKLRMRFDSGAMIFC